MSLDRDEWIAEARTVPIETALERRGVRLKGAGAERVGPCPVCGGTDRFAINLRKGVFVCRGSGQGGDVIALTRYLEACDFNVACEILTGRPAPGRREGETPEARAVREAALAKRAAARARISEAKEQEQARFRERERRKCWEAWSGAGPVPGSPAEAYLALRGLTLPPMAALRCAADHPLYADGGAKAEIVHRGPALLGAIVGPSGRFAGLHATWIDLSAPGGKVLIADPATGELVPAKKVRGSATGGHIPLVPCAAATDLVVGEGNETTLSVWRALSARNWEYLPGAAFWSAYSLVNIAGPATESVKHPSQRLVDALGRERARKVPGPMPDLSRPGLPIPASVQRIWLLGDGDSDHFTTKTALTRAARRFLAGRPDLDVRVAWAPTGEDFNDVLRRAAA
ncbi:putative DNA primase [Methylobacterium sp. ME121]|nr:putative DNA primase [Methylobacterium sp. ME121]